MPSSGVTSDDECSIPGSLNVPSIVSLLELPWDPDPSKSRNEDMSTSLVLAHLSMSFPCVIIDAPDHTSRQPGVAMTDCIPFLGGSWAARQLLTIRLVAIRGMTVAIHLRVGPRLARVTKKVIWDYDCAIAEAGKATCFFMLIINNLENAVLAF